MRVFLGTALALLALNISPASAFIYLKGSVYEKGERPVSDAPVWTGRVLKFYVNTDLSALGGSNALPITGSELLQSVQEAVAAWSQACRADIQIEVAGSTTGIYNSSDGVNTILWDRRTTGEGNYYGSDTAQLAAATTVLRGSEFADCDIVLNGNSATIMKFSPAMGESDLRSVITHEIGHCLGLDHPIEPPDYDSANTYLTTATMVQTATLPDPSDTSRRDINQDDRDGLECIYERGAPLRSGARCSSYHGTNGGGTIVGSTAITGGPSTTDTNCGTDAQGRNARPSTESGDGCIGAAVAGTAPGPHSGSDSLGNSVLRHLGGTWGFLSLFLIVGFAHRFRRRSLRRIATIALTLALFSTTPAHAWDLELAFGTKKVSPGLWKSFSEMDPSALSWSRDPSPIEISHVNEISATAFTEKTEWGKWGAFLTFTLPTQTDTNAQASNSSEQSKSTTIGGLRLGPHLRYFPLATNPASIRWFLGGKMGIGILYGTQKFESTSVGSVSYRAWSTEFSLSTGAEIPVGPFKIVAEGGYSRVQSSYFTSTGNEGTSYSDFPSGTRLSVDTGPTTEDLKFTASGLFAAVGIQIPFGDGKSAPRERKPEPKFDDYEPMKKSESFPAEKASGEPKKSAPVPEALPTPAPTAAPTPVAPVPGVEPVPLPLADPLEEERKFQESLRRPGPSEVPAPAPAVPAPAKKRNQWEIDEVPWEAVSGGNLTPPPRPGRNEGDPVPSP